MKNEKGCWFPTIGLYSFIVEYKLLYRTIVCLSISLLLASQTAAETGVIVDGPPVLRFGSTISFIATVYSNSTSNITLERLEVYNEQGNLLENQTINKILFREMYTSIK